MGARGYLALVLHAHLPFVRHPEHEHFLEETWLFEAVIETYLPLLRVMQGWQRDGLKARLTISLSPTLCSMLNDSVLRSRCGRHLRLLQELAEKEIVRHTFEPELQSLAIFYRDRLAETWRQWDGCGGDLLREFKQLRETGAVELITTAATHPVLPLLATHPPSIRAQVRTGCDTFRSCFGPDPAGFWLPECAWTPELEPFLREANLRWFITETHGILGARPSPQFGSYAPVITPGGVGAFGRDHASARQVWSRDGGYPGDFRYREFYRDAGFDAEHEYVRPYLASGERGFTGFKYHRITGPGPEKQLYNSEAAQAAVREHAAHFLQARLEQAAKLNPVMDRPPIMVAPYDAELFGHWWFEGPEFLDRLVRQAEGGDLECITPGDYLRRHPVNQAAQPAVSSWGEQGYWKVWLNENNEWIHRALQTAQVRMSDLARQLQAADGLERRALRQAGRELLLAQSSDWPFILRTGTSPGYATARARHHLQAFNFLHEELVNGRVEEALLRSLEERDNLFPGLDPGVWT